MNEQMTDEEVRKVAEHLYDEELHICRECLNKLRKVIKNEEETTD